jgi:poly(beta-D-mannuronate) lyase
MVIIRFVYYCRVYLFEHCDGELEIISNKSCRNTLRYNTFFESQGTLTLRHGNDAKVYGNVFIGNQLKNTGGIRIIGERHVVSNNHFQGLKGTGVSAAISIMDGVKDSPLVGYYQVKQAKVLNNTVIDCEEAFSLGTGKNENRNLPPQQCVIAANHLLRVKKLVAVVDSLVDAEMKDNVLYSNTAPGQLEGFKIVDEKFFPDSLKRLSKEETGSIPLPEGDVGAGWMK